MTDAKIATLKFLDYPVNRAKFHFDRAQQLMKQQGNSRNIKTAEGSKKRASSPGKEQSSIVLERAVIEIQRASSLQPDFLAHYMLLAECYRRAMDTSSAIFALRYVLKLEPTYARAKQDICNLLIQRG